MAVLFTKPDLADPTPWAEIYRKAGYPTAVVNNRTGKGLEAGGRAAEGAGSRPFAATAAPGKAA